MNKSKILTMLACLGLLMTACNSNSKPAESSQPDPTPASTQPAESTEPVQSIDPAPVAHVHDYEAVGAAVKNADGKDVFEKKCKDNDDQYIGIAFDDYSEKSADFGDTSSYSGVPEEIRNESHLIAKNNTVTWKINVSKAIENAELKFGAVFTGGDHGSKGAKDGNTVKYSVKVNNGDFADWEMGENDTYSSVGLSQTARAYVKFATINLVAGENVITLRQNNAGYRLLFGGEVRVHFTGDATPVAAPAGHTATFTVGEHAKVLVYEAGQDYSVAPVEKTTTKARDKNGQIVDYAEANEETGAAEVKPQINFQVVLDKGYWFDDGIEKTFTHQEGDPENLKESPEVKAKDIPWVTPTANFNKAKIIEVTNGENKTYIYRLTKVKGDITVTINPKAELQQPLGTFFAPAELSDDGKALFGGASIVPILIKLGANDAVEVNVNGASAGAATIKSFDNHSGKLVITTAGYGDLAVTYNPESGLLEGLSVLANKTVLKYDGYLNMYGNDKLKYWDCDGTTEELQAQWNRRYGDPWTLDTVNGDRVTSSETNAKNGKSMKLRAYKDNRFALTTKVFSEKFNGRNVSFWVYNSGESDVTIQLFGYNTNSELYNSNFGILGNTTLKPGWTFISAGFTPKDMYAFQVFVAKTANVLYFDDICLF